MASSNHIKALREAAGLTQFDLAVLLHIPTSTISRWELGTFKPRAGHRAALAARLRVSEEALGLTAG